MGYFNLDATASEQSTDHVAIQRTHLKVERIDPNGWAIRTRSSDLCAIGSDSPGREKQRTCNHPVSAFSAVSRRRIATVN